MRGPRERQTLLKQKQKVCVGSRKEKRGRRQVKGKEEEARRVVHCVSVLRTVSDIVYDI